MASQRVATTPGTALREETVQELRAGFHGDLLLPGPNGYDAARRVWNGMIDKRPAVIARCAGVADVMNAVEFARTHDLVVAVRGGGHNVAGNAVCDAGIVIDLSPMKGIRVDPKTRTARAQGGVTWGEFDRETQAFGLATTGGEVSTTGIAGLTLGGGIGWLMGKYGLACDNLLSADVVTADGRFLTASATENEDLFWGLRGGGGNFGIVTSFEYRLHPVGPVLGGMVAHPLDRAGEVLRFYRDFTAEAPDELKVDAGLLTHPEAGPIVAMALCYCGDVSKGERAVERLRKFGPPLADMLQPMPYLDLQRMLDASFPAGRQNYWKGSFLKGLSDEAIDTFVDYGARVTSPMTFMLVENLHGAARRVKPTETAFSHRQAPYNLIIVSMWADPAESERHIRWTREFSEAMEPFSTGGVYVNYLGEEGEERVRAAYGLNYERLVALKNKYDPTNFFRLNQNIKPTV